MLHYGANGGYSAGITVHVPMSICTLFAHNFTFIFSVATLLAPCLLRNLNR